MAALNAIIRAFNLYEESPKRHNSFFRGNFELARTSTSQTQEGWQKEDRAPSRYRAGQQVYLEHSILSVAFWPFQATRRSPHGWVRCMLRSDERQVLFSTSYWGNTQGPPMDGLWGKGSRYLTFPLAHCPNLQCTGNSQVSLKNGQYWFHTIVGAIATNCFLKLPQCQTPILLKSMLLSRFLSV